MISINKFAIDEFSPKRKISENNRQNANMQKIINCKKSMIFASSDGCVFLKEEPKVKCLSLIPNKR